MKEPCTALGCHAFAVWQIDEPDDPYMTTYACDAHLVEPGLCPVVGRVAPTHWIVVPIGGSS